MTKLEYLIFLVSNKGFLYMDESRWNEVIEEDKEILVKHGYVRIEGNPGFETISITKRGETYLNSVE